MRVQQFNDERFTCAFSHGAGDDDVTFPEPTVTHECHHGLVDGTGDDACSPLELPRVWEGSGW